MKTGKSCLWTQEFSPCLPKPCWLGWDLHVSFSKGYSCKQTMSLVSTAARRGAAAPGLEAPRGWAVLREMGKGGMVVFGGCTITYGGCAEEGILVSWAWRLPRTVL